MHWKLEPLILPLLVATLLLIAAMQAGHPRDSGASSLDHRQGLSSRMVSRE
jgi:hypothetical protein